MSDQGDYLIMVIALFMVVGWYHMFDLRKYYLPSEILSV